MAKASRTLGTTRGSKPEPAPPNPALKLVPGVQGENEDTFAYIARNKREHEKTSTMLKAIRAGRFVRPTIGIHAGQWGSRISEAAPRIIRAKAPKGKKGAVLKTLVVHKREERTLWAPSAVELVLTATVACCHACGCDTDMHSTREPLVEEVTAKSKDTLRCGGERIRELEVVPCACLLTPVAIMAKQSSREWIADRYRDEMVRRNKRYVEHVDEANLFDGMRGPDSAPKEEPC